MSGYQGRITTTVNQINYLLEDETSKDSSGLGAYTRMHIVFIFLKTSLTNCAELKRNICKLTVNIPTLPNSRMNDYNLFNPFVENRKHQSVSKKGTIS